MQPPLEPPSASMGVEVSCAVSGSRKMALMEKRAVKESIEMLRGRWFVSELLFRLGLLGKISNLFSLFYTFDGWVSGIYFS